MISLPLGAVRLQQEFLRTDPPEKQDIAQRLRQFVDKELKRAERKLGQPRVPLVIATSGTAAALSEASAAIAKKNGHRRTRRGKPHITPLEAVRRLSEKLVKMSNVQRSSIPGIGTKRSEIIIGGAIVYAHLMERLELKGFRYSPLGLGNGILEQMLAESDVRASVHRKMESERWDGVLEVCRRYNVDQHRAEPVRQHVVQLYDELAGVHDLPEDYKLWLEAAAMMADVGKFMNHQGHHRHTQYILANSEIYGFSPEQRAIVAAIARFLGKSRPDPMDRPMRIVPVEEHPHVTRAVVLLRLAVALNQDRASAVLRMRTHVYPKRVLVELVPGRGGAELEAWSLKKEAGYFREEGCLSGINCTVEVARQTTADLHRDENSQFNTRQELSISATSSAGTCPWRWRKARARCAGPAATAALPGRACSSAARSSPCAAGPGPGCYGRRGPSRAGWMQASAGKRQSS